MYEVPPQWGYQNVRAIPESSVALAECLRTSTRSVRLARNENPWSIPYRHAIPISISVRVIFNQVRLGHDLLDSEVRPHRSASVRPLQRRLLQDEGTPFSGHHVDLAACGWNPAQKKRSGAIGSRPRRTNFLSELLHESQRYADGSRRGRG